MRDLTGENLTEAVLAGYENCKSPRFQEIMRSLVRHLLAFIREVELTEEGWFEGIRFLTKTGQISDDNRQEFILLSDMLGVSMLVIGINNRKPAGATESTVCGPFYVADAPLYKTATISLTAPGEPCFIQGQVRSVNGEPIANAHLDV